MLQPDHPRKKKVGLGGGRGNVNREAEPFILQAPGTLEVEIGLARSAFDKVGLIVQLKSQNLSWRVKTKLIGCILSEIISSTQRHSKVKRGTTDGFIEITRRMKTQRSRRWLLSAWCIQPQCTKFRDSNYSATLNCQRVQIKGKSGWPRKIFSFIKTLGFMSKFHGNRIIVRFGLRPSEREHLDFLDFALWRTIVFHNEGNNFTYVGSLEGSYTS